MILPRKPPNANQRTVAVGLFRNQAFVVLCEHANGNHHWVFVVVTGDIYARYACCVFVCVCVSQKNQKSEKKRSRIQKPDDVNDEDDATLKVKFWNLKTRYF